MSHFESDQSGVPALADGMIAGHFGSVSTNFKSGAILAQNDQGKVFRLSWNEGKENYRNLEPGNYVVRGYRIIQKSPNGETWHISAMGPKIKSFQVVAGKSVNVLIDSKINANQRISTSNGMAQLSMEIFGENRAGLSIYRNGKRIPIGYELSSGGKVAAGGKMNYG